MTKIKQIIKRLAEPASCPNGHQSYIMLPDGTYKCMDCQITWK